MTMQKVLASKLRLVMVTAATVASTALMIVSFFSLTPFTPLHLEGTVSAVQCSVDNKNCTNNPIPISPPSNGCNNQPTVPGITSKCACPQGNCLIKKYVQPALNLAAAGVGIAATASYIWAGISYSKSADNSQKVSEAKQRIVTTTFVVVGYLVFYALMNYLLPGGLV